MVHKILHTLVILSLIIKAVSTFIKNYSSVGPESIWFHVSGISAGVFVLLGVIWAMVFFHGDNFARTPKVYKFLLVLAALLAVCASLISL